MVLGRLQRVTIYKHLCILNVKGKRELQSTLVGREKGVKEHLPYGIVGKLHVVL